MIKVLAALAALGLATSGTAIAQPNDRCDSPACKGAEAIGLAATDSVDDNLNWSTEHQEAQVFFKAEITKQPSCFLSNLFDSDLRTWARHNPVLAGRLWLKDSPGCLMFDSRATKGIGPVADGQQYAEMIRYKSTVIQAVMAASPNVFEFNLFPANSCKDNEERLLALQDINRYVVRDELSLNSN